MTIKRIMMIQVPAEIEAASDNAFKTAKREALRSARNVCGTISCNAPTFRWRIDFTKAKAIPNG